MSAAQILVGRRVSIRWEPLVRPLVLQSSARPVKPFLSEAHQPSQLSLLLLTGNQEEDSQETEEQMAADEDAD